MKYVVLFVGTALVLASSASAQEGAVGSVSEAAPAEPAPAPQEAPPPEEEKRSVYYKKTQGWLWMEAFAGPSTYDPDQFTSLSITGATPNIPKLNGPEYGFAAGLGLGGLGPG
ncbi:MAG: hypothetical protein O7F08_00500, partial [Deltaproteobacteria bacterium]|nr:hypothetical protein [Deltaproteobacteria bacterium]